MLLPNANKTELSLSTCVSRLCAPGIDHPGDHRSVCHPLPSQESLQGKRMRLLVTFILKYIQLGHYILGNQNVL